MDCYQGTFSGDASGELFIELGLITPPQLRKALIKAKGEKKRLGQMLKDLERRRASWEKQLAEKAQALQLLQNRVVRLEAQLAEAKRAAASRSTSRPATRPTSRPATSGR